MVKTGKNIHAAAVIWRRIFARLTQFLRSVDYLITEMLRTIVTSSVQQLTHFILTSYQAGLEVAAQEELEAQVRSDWLSVG